MRRRAFTLVEMLVAMAAACLVIVLLYTGLVYYFRAYTREDEILERSRRTQEVLSLLRDDLERSDGAFKTPGDVPEAAVSAVGFEGSPSTLLTLPRAGTNYISAFSARTSSTPYLCKKYPYKEVWDIVAGMLALQPLACTYTKDKPPPKIAALIPQWGFGGSIVHVPVPFEQPASHYWLIRRVVDGVVTPVVWAFHSKRHGRFPAGSLLRYSNGLASIGGDQLTEFEVEVVNEWSYIDPAPPKRPFPLTTKHKFMGFFRTAFGRSRVVGPDPGFTDRTILLVGP